MFDKRTNYSIHNEDGQKTTIALAKLVADVLQESLSDVHAWIQSVYDKISKNKPGLGRRKKGDLVRLLSEIEAKKSPRYQDSINRLLGM